MDKRLATIRAKLREKNTSAGKTRENEVSLENFATARAKDALKQRRVFQKKTNEHAPLSHCKTFKSSMPLLNASPYGGATVRNSSYSGEAFRFP